MHAHCRGIQLSDIRRSFPTLLPGHGDPMDFWDHATWRLIPQNNPRADEPSILTPSLVKHVNPDVKLILILRDPIERRVLQLFGLHL